MYIGTPGTLGLPWTINNVLSPSHAAICPFYVYWFNHIYHSAVLISPNPLCSLRITTRVIRIGASDNECCRLEPTEVKLNCIVKYLNVRQNTKRLCYCSTSMGTMQTTSLLRHI